MDQVRDDMGEGKRRRKQVGVEEKWSDGKGKGGTYTRTSGMELLLMAGYDPVGGHMTTYLTLELFTSLVSGCSTSSTSIRCGVRTKVEGAGV